MDISLADIIRELKELPQAAYALVLGAIRKQKEATEEGDRPAPVTCIHCGESCVVRNGKRHGKQAYICKRCGKTFVSTTNTAIYYSHQSLEIWKQVINDTVNGVSIEKTAKSIGISHSTVFNMRHKILSRIEDNCITENNKIKGTSEADETYVLESLKGTKIPQDYYRGPRKHGAVALNRGISNEYFCICTTVGPDNACTAKSVNRASPSKHELNEIYGDRVDIDTVLICDGNKNYDVLSDKCTVAHAEHINKVNGFHSFIKERVEKARGFATKYLNRYNTLFAECYGKLDAAAERLFELVTDRNGQFLSIAVVKEHRLLNV